MAKEPRPGNVKTRLSPSLSPDEAAELARCFVLDTVELGQSAASDINGLDVKIACTPPNASKAFEDLLDDHKIEDVEVVPQSGAKLGERLDHVIGCQLDAGYRMVAAINSDGPSLPLKSVVSAFETLDRDDVDIVLGPAEDGGYYLIGMKRRWPQVTIDVEMSTSTVLKETVAIAESLGARVELLPPWFDVDEPADLRRLERDIEAGIDCGHHTKIFLTAGREVHACTLAVIAPALNEAGNIATVVKDVLRETGTQQFVDAEGRAIELQTTMIVVDNGSTDDTAEQALNAGATVISEPRRGYGYACNAGAIEALNQAADLLVFIDGDQSSLPGEIRSLIDPLLTESADLVLGSRTRGTIDRGAMTPHQRFGNWLTSKLMSAIYRLDVTDLGPYRAISADLFQKLQMSEMTFGWPTEMMVKASKSEATVIEVPVTWMNRAEGKSKVSGTIKGSILAGWHILKVTLRHARY